jgi:hypothetical protein
MRAFAILALAATAAILAGSATGARGAGGTESSGHTAVTITYWDDGQGRSDPEVWTLRCNPPRGNHPRPALACRRLEAGGRRLVVPVPATAICTQIYGGPQVARVVGYLDGRRVWARFTRENGCQIERWSRLSPWLFPAGSVR